MRPSAPFVNAVLQFVGLQAREGICIPLLFLFGLLASGTALQAEAPRDEAWLASLLNPPSLTNVQLSPDGTRLAMIQNLRERSGSLLVTDLVKGETSRLGSGDDFKLYYLNWTGDDGLVFKVSKEVWNNFYDVGIYYTAVNRLRSDHPVDSGSSITVVGLPRERPKRMIAWVKSSAPSTSDQKPQHLGIVEYNVGISSASAFGRRPNARPIVHTYPSVPGAELLAVQSDREGELGWWACLEKMDTKSGGLDVCFFVFQFKGHR